MLPLGIHVRIELLGNKVHVCVTLLNNCKQHSKGVNLYSPVVCESSSYATFLRIIFFVPLVLIVGVSC